MYVHIEQLYVSVDMYTSLQICTSDDLRGTFERACQKSGLPRLNPDRRSVCRERVTLFSAPVTTAYIFTHQTSFPSSIL